MSHAGAWMPAAWHALMLADRGQVLIILQPAAHSVPAAPPGQAAPLLTLRHLHALEQRRIVWPAPEAVPALAPAVRPAQCSPPQHLPAPGRARSSQQQQWSVYAGGTRVRGADGCIDCVDQVCPAVTTSPRRHLAVLCLPAGPASTHTFVTPCGANNTPLQHQPHHWLAYSMPCIRRRLLGATYFQAPS
jgi:hypothetical protein